MLGDPKFVDVDDDIKSIINKDTAKKRRGRIDDVSN
jgi:gamma-glutamyltranspeptidase